MSLFDCGDDVFKGAMHGAALLLALQMGAYNGIVYKRRGTGWHLFSSVMYVAFVTLEIVQVYRHAYD